MTNGIWDEVLTQAAEYADESGDDELMVGLSQGGRHRKILRDKMLMALSGVLISTFRAGEISMDKINREIDSAIKAVVSNAEKDGLELDDKLLSILADASGRMLGIAEEWYNVKVILTQSD
ncbi:hypothetical protein [Alteromonas sp. 14N.309.X.WAT.G.H12]|uniref:hypothetical protein n=1 Tax=Alteromonas sp. 14N.309.X.WAT.G.H12 TaxID=3120824 RepID=UPI002FD011FD